MYGKIFESMYHGTLAGNWKALITFQQMIVLSNDEGIIDMTPHAISNITGIPLEIIEEGIKYLEQPDIYSRTPDHEGRRIERLDEHRPWGWIVLNKVKYKRLASREEKKAADRERLAAKRNAEKPNKINNVAVCRTVSQPVADVAHTNTDTYTNTINTLSGKPDPSPPKNNFKPQAEEILTFLNTKANRAFQPVPANIDLIVNRLKEGATPGQCRQVIARKIMDWATDDNMHTYLRPKTLFNRTNFAQYVGELVVEDE